MNTKSSIIYMYYIFFNVFLSGHCKELVRIMLIVIHSKSWFRFLMFNATFNNILVISWWSVLLVEETGGPRENHRPVTNILSHNAVSSTPHLSGTRTHKVSGDRH